MNKPVLIWFRRDLRLNDHPALLAALDSGQPLIPIYIHAPHEEAPWQPGAASRWWLHHALAALATALSRLGSRLIVRQGDSLAALQRLVTETGADTLHWQRLYDPATRWRDTAIETWAQTTGLQAVSHPGSLLVEPWQVATGQGKPYRVFTPFHKACQRCGEPAMPVPAPDRLPAVSPDIDSLDLNSLALLPAIPWDQGMAAHWTPGETGAANLLAAFACDPVRDYDTLRDIPGQDGTSRLSPYLHHGELSPRQVYWACRAHGAPAAPFLRQLYWREFAHHLLYHFPRTMEQPLDDRFTGLLWQGDHAKELAAWQQGRTGIPIVDAGMRQLWQHGWMHNRVRMLVASLLTKNLMIPWQDGSHWFWDTLVDADLANNTLGWQWTAGCGADAAPFFRIFNPIVQSERFDPKGDYLRHWLPELARLPDKWIHKPWEAPVAIQQAAGLPADCPWLNPIIDLKQSRLAALELWTQIKRQPRTRHPS